MASAFRKELLQRTPCVRHARCHACGSRRRCMATFQVDTSGLLGSQREGQLAAPSPPRSLPVRQTPLLEFLRSSITLRGPLSVAEFMKYCLAHPVHGYYMRSPDAIFGKGGDFVTSPEISTLFGELLAVWAFGYWLEMPQSRTTPSFRLIECGPGRGVLAHDMIKTLRRLSRGQSMVSAVHLVETSPSCRAAQASALGCLFDEQSKADGESAVIGASGPWPGLRVHWHDRVGDVPTGAPVVIVAHVSDALFWLSVEATPSAGAVGYVWATLAICGASLCPAPLTGAF
jgi:hypothetical protein